MNYVCRYFRGLIFYYHIERWAFIGQTTYKRLNSVVIIIERKIKNLSRIPVRHSGGGVPPPRSNRNQPTRTMPPPPPLPHTNWKRLQKKRIIYIYIHNIAVHARTHTHTHTHTHTRFNVTHRKMSLGPRPLSPYVILYTPRSDVCRSMHTLTHTATDVNTHTHTHIARTRVHIILWI